MAKRNMHSDEIEGNFPSNSHVSKDKASYISKKTVETHISTEKSSSDIPEKKKIQKVANAKVRKHGLLRRLGKSIIEDSIEAAKEKAYNEIIVPGLKALIFDTGSEILDIILFGGDGSGRDYRSNRSNRRRDDRTSYSDYYERKRGGRRSDERRVDPRYEPDDIIVDTRGDANRVLDDLDDIIHRYGQASVADFYDLVGVTSDWPDNSYGWTSLRGASIKPVRDGFMIILPRTRVLDD